ncbi:MAG: recombinase family protein, partial [Armatimonadota bacterium]
MKEIFADHNDIIQYERELSSDQKAVRVAFYIRCSSPKQVNKGHTLHMQTEYTRNYCIGKFGHNCQVTYVIDGGYSGKLTFERTDTTDVKTRPALTFLTQLIERRHVDYVGVYRCDRLFRNVREWLAFREDYLEQYDVQFFSATEPIDTKTISGRVMLGLLMGVAEQKLDDISESVRRSLSARRQDGYTCGSPGYGWRYQDRSTVEQGQRRGIEPAPEEVDIVLQVIDWFVTGKSFKWIARELTHRRIPPPYRGERWDPGTVQRMVLNHQHCGMIINSEGELEPGAHYSMRIIEKELHDELKRRWNLRAAKYARPDRRQIHWLAEHPRCAKCGQLMTTRVNPGSTRSFICKGRDPERPHEGFGVRVDVLERYVICALEQLSGHKLLRRAT